MKGYKKRPKGHNIHYTLPNGRKQTLEADAYYGKQHIDIKLNSADVDRSEAIRRLVEIGLKVKT